MARRPKLTPEEFLVQQNPEEQLPVEVRQLRALVFKYKRKAELQQALVTKVVLDAAMEAFEPIRLDLTVKPRIQKSPPRRTPEAQQMLISDLQCGKQSSSYSMDILEKELDLYFSTCLSIAEIARAHHPVDELVIHMNGDLVEGEQIYAHQAMEISTGVLSQALFGAQITAREIAEISPHYPKIRVIFTPGNHGRSGKEFDPETNWDLVWGHFVQHLLSQVKNVQVEVCHNWYTVSRVKGWGFFQAHGDDIISWLSIPWYGVTQKVMRWLDSIDEAYDYALLGHFHNFANFSWNYTEIVMNGTTECGSEFAKKRYGLTGRPMQMTWFTHPQHGMTARYPIWLDTRKPRVKA